jgi:pimeloyl-ACP methyl ester carboxylesterase
LEISPLCVILIIIVINERLSMNFEQELVLKIGQLAETGVAGTFALLFFVLSLVTLGTIVLKKAGTKALVSSFAVLAVVAGLSSGFVAGTPSANAATLGNSNTSVTLELDRNSEAVLDTTVNVGNDNPNGYTLYARTQGIDLSLVTIQVNGITLTEAAGEIHKTSVQNADANYPAQVKAISTENPYLVTGKVIYSVVENTPDVSQYYNQSVNWHRCIDGDAIDREVVDADGAPEPDAGNYDCGTIQAPMNWFDQNSAPISLYLARYNSHNQTGKLGSVVLNPGGPGSSGIGSLIAEGKGKNISDGQFKITGVTEGLPDYDIVSYDPRGVMRSSQLICTTTAASCFTDTPSELPKYMDTVMQSHDLDLVRAVLGETKLNYVGFSWGSMLGAAYTGEFPDKVGRFVLDGIVPFEQGNSIVSYDLNIVRLDETRRVLDDILDNCLNNTDSTPTMQDACPFTGPTAQNLRDQFENLFERAIVESSSNPSNPYNVDQLIHQLRSGFSDREMPKTVRYYADADDALTGPATGWDTLALPSSTLSVDVLQAPFNTSVVSDTSDGYSTLVTSCEDARMTEDQNNAWAAYAVEKYSDMPAVGQFLANEFNLYETCVGVPERVTSALNYGNLDLPTILLSHSKWDYNTPPVFTDRVKAQFPYVTTVEYLGAGHCSYAYSALLATAVNHFLNTGVLPVDGTQYPRTPFGPVPSPSS